MIARRTCAVDYDGQRITITAGQTRVVPDHELVRRFPSLWEPEPDERRIASSNGLAPVRSALGGDQPRRGMTAAEQGRIRRARLDELAARERERPAPADAETSFWE